MRRELAMRFEVSLDRIVVVQHGFDRVLPPDLRRRAEWRAEAGIPADAKVLLFFGNVARYKGLDILLESFRTTGTDDQIHLIIAGRCRDSELRKEIQAQIESHPFRTRIHWFDGFVPEEALPALVHGADLLVLPYRHIDQSGVVFLALSAGLPVVASDVGSIKDYVIPGAGTLVPAGDPIALGDAVAGMLGRSQPVDRHALIRAARAYSWAETVKPILQEYAAV